MSSWTGRRPALTPDQVAELSRIRHLIESIPTVHQLAAKWQVSEQTIRNYLGKHPPKRYTRLAGNEHD